MRSLLDGQVVTALGVTLLHSLWQGVAIAVLAGGVLWLMRGAVPQLRYACTCIALAAILASSVITFLASWQAQGIVASGPLGPSADTFRVVVLGWIIGSTIMASRFGGGWLRVRNVVGRAEEISRIDLRTIADRLAPIIGLSHLPRLLQSHEVSVPLVFGILRPVVVLPVRVVTGLPPDLVEAVIAHELVHVRRLDFLVNVLQGAIETLLFYHPAVWWLSRRIRHERELCCDDIAVAVLDDDRLRYGRALFEVERLREGPLPAVSSQGGNLMKRIERIVQPGEHRHSSATTTWVAAIALVTTTAAVACVELGDTLLEDRGADFEPSGRAAIIDDATDPSTKTSIAWLPDRVRTWEPEFDRAAERHGIDAALLAVVTLVESGGDPRAKSPAGARGLMQIMPETAERIASTRGLENHDVARLDDPAYNVDFGAWLLAHELENLPPGMVGDAIGLAAAAYNGGEAHLRAHLETGAPLAEEPRRYGELVGALYRERHYPSSPTFETMQSGQLRTVSRNPTGIVAE